MLKSPHDLADCKARWRDCSNSSDELPTLSRSVTDAKLEGDSPAAR